jgi:flagellar FliJ protein
MNPDVSETTFRFGLERVRQVRAHDEDRAKEELAAGIAARLRGEALLRAAQERLADAHALGRGGTALPASGAVLVARQAWTERVERSRVDAEHAVSAADADVAARREALAAAGRRREVLDRLRERKLAEHRLAGARAEGAALDEMALGMHVRAARSVA